MATEGAARRTHLFKPAADSVLGGLHSYERHYALRLGLVQLIYLLWIFGDILIGRSRVNGTWWLVTLLSLPPEILLAWTGLSRARRYLPWSAFAMAVIGVVVMRWNYCGGSTYVLTCAGSLLGFYQPARRAVIYLALLLLGFMLAARLQQWPWLVIGLLSMLSIASGTTGLVMQQGRRKNVALRLSQEQVRRLATLAERERIGRDLHDLLGHTLSLVALKSELARKLAVRDPGAAQREMEEVERVARHALTEVRAAVTGMRRSDLAAELVSARLMLEASGISFVADVPAQIALPPSVEASLALVLREAITNIHRHAHASEARVLCSFDAAALHMQISDNGCGGLSAHGNGVSGMRERVRELGGTLEIDSPARRGTRLSMQVPLAASASTKTIAPSGAWSAA